MKKSQTLPKIVAAVVLLVLAIVFSGSAWTVGMARLMGGGVMNFTEAGFPAYRNNRPAEGSMKYIIGCSGGSSSDNSDFTIKNGYYYYLVTLGGKEPIQDSKNDVLLLKAQSGSEACDQLNDLWRKSAKDENYDYLRISGITKKATKEEEEIFEEISKTKKDINASFIGYSIDCTKPVSWYTKRFFLSFTVDIAFIFSLWLVIQAFKKNRNLDEIEHERAVFQAAQKFKSGNANPDGSDAMFGDTEREYSAEQYQGGTSSNKQYGQQTQYQGGTSSNQQYGQQTQYQGGTFNNQPYGQSRYQDDSQDDGFYGGNRNNNNYDGFY